VGGGKTQRGGGAGDRRLESERWVAGLGGGARLGDGWWRDVRAAAEIIFQCLNVRIFRAATWG
jgi:hypothetical protein